MSTPTPTPQEVFHWQDLDLAAVHRDRIRVRGTIVSIADGYRSRYRQALITMSTGPACVQFTASPSGTLARLPCGAQALVDVTLTGFVDLSSTTYIGERVRLIETGGQAGN
jgi:hypothetical protein